MVGKHGWMFFGVTLGLICAGCEHPGGNFKSASQIKQEKGAGLTDEHGHHDHGAGPHGGAIVELGDEEYHAEVVVDAKAHALKVYLLGKDAKTAAPVAAQELAVTTEDDKKLTLKASPQAGDGEGKSSLFELTDEAAVDAIVKAGYLHGSLQLEIDGKPYRGDGIDIHLDGTEHDDHAEHKEDAKPAEPAPAATEAPKSEEPAKEGASEK